MSGKISLAGSTSMEKGCEALMEGFIQNAIRYNVQDGKVDVCIKQNGNHTDLIVKDTGIGIPAADQERVLE